MQIDVKHMGNLILTKVLKQSELIGNNHIFNTISEIKKQVAHCKLDHAELQSFWNY